MYIIEKLLQDYPQHKEDIENFDLFLHRSFKNPESFAIVEKDNYKWVDAGFKYKDTDKSESVKNFAYYETSFSFDKDFLAQFVDDIDITNMTVDEIRKYLMKEDYDEEHDNELKEKLGL